jgi:prephenate dehydrogenase
VTSTTQLAVERIEDCLVAGCNGQFGRIFVAKLAAEGVLVSGLDLQDEPAEGLELQEYLRGDIAEPSAGAERSIRRAQCVLLCVPEPTILTAIPLVRQLVQRDHLAVDIASVRTRIGEVLKVAPGPGGYLGVHPMFGPVADFAQRNVCIIPFAENGRSRWFTQLLMRWGARLTTLTAREHDRVTAYTQALPHAAILSFAAALTQAGEPHDLTLRLATPIHTTMLALAARIVSGEPSLYWTIQADNPYAAEARELLRLSLARLQEAVEAGNPLYLEGLFDGVVSTTGADHASLKDRASRIVDVAKGS